MIIDLQTGEATDWGRIEGAVNELHDVAFLPGKACPSMIGLKSKEIQKVISIDE